MYKISFPFKPVVVLCLSLLCQATPAHAGRELWAWGMNIYGQLGDGTENSRAKPARVTELTGVVAASAGTYHSAFLKRDGTVWAEGSNANGALGDGSHTERSAPVQVGNLSSITAVSAGELHSLALKGDGTVWGWGGNSHGQADWGFDPSTTPAAQVRGIANVTAIACGNSHSLALTRDGGVWMWGDWNFVGGGPVYRPFPAQVGGLPTCIAVAGGHRFSVALASDGTVWTWGENNLGQLGDGTTESRGDVIQVPGLVNVIAIAAGEAHTLALKRDGTVWSWGFNAYGELGDGSQTVRSSPLKVAGLAGVTAVRAGGFASYAIKNDGSVWAWGDNYSGYLGDGSNTQFRLTPIRLAINGVIDLDSSGLHSLAIVDASYSIHGRISNALGDPLEGVAVRRSGSNVPAITNNAGYYSFTNLDFGTYTITPSRPGTRFIPPTKTVRAGIDRSTGHNFIGATGYKISGRITGIDGRGLFRARVYRSGRPEPVLTNDAGYYTFIDVPNGSVTITPGEPNRYFLPASRTVAMYGADIIGQNFAEATPYKIIGRLATSTNVSLEGVKVTRSGSDVPAITNNAGYYVFSGVVNGTYTVTPQLEGYIFAPANKSVTVRGADAAGQNFVGAAP